MDGSNIVDFATAFAAPKSLLEGIPVYHTTKWFRAITARLKGVADLQLESYSIIRRPIVTATFIDPDDGKKYRMTLEPIIEGQNDGGAA